MIVVDSSVVLKWVFDDEDAHEKAIKYRRMHIYGEETIAVPSLFFYEIANVLATKTKLSTSEAADFFLTFWNFGFEVFDFGLEEFLSGIALSRQYKTSLYDAAYIELARRLNCKFITADRRLYKKTKEIKKVGLL
ncbi:MAG: type II toxin-antitoxin system VapC family toxin [Nitrospiraceae bacterium]|jgi:predicted nucleic acid-binding protein|nr:type II toxin-antitoxin system VapC family toxin [Nitrospiraceae bacterium]